MLKQVLTAHCGYLLVPSLKLLVELQDLCFLLVHHVLLLSFTVVPIHHLVLPDHSHLPLSLDCRFLLFLYFLLERLHVVLHHGFVGVPLWTGCLSMYNFILAILPRLNDGSFEG
jgi:hypothetical protein